MSDVTLRHVSKTYARSGTVVDDVDITIDDGEFFTLLGPSGCGKSTTLRMIAGFEDPSAGQILFGERDVTLLPPEKRGVGLVFQNYALFPHMSVGRNVAFGLEAHRVPKGEHAARVKEALEQVRLPGYENARVDELSGGQQQRVALARAVVMRPQLLLLDEPLSNLDAKLREETRSSLRKLHAETGLTSIYVTHDQAEALAMSTRIAVMSRAVVNQVGTPREVYDKPATRFVAEFLGRSNIVDGVIESIDGDRVVVKSGEHRIVVTGRHRTDDVELRVGADVGVAIKAEDVRIAAPGDSGENHFPGKVTDAEYVGPRVECEVATELGAMGAEVEVRLQPEREDAMTVVFPAERLYLVGPRVDPVAEKKR